MLLPRQAHVRNLSYIVLVLVIFLFSLHIWTARDARPLRISPAGHPEQPEQAKVDEIPKNIWFKLGPSGLSKDTKNWTETCIDANPNYRAQYFTDEKADAWVKKTFSSRSDINKTTLSRIVESYLGLTVPILKADLLRYLLLLDQGGVWFDLDISCEGPPIDQWIPPEYKNASVVVGWEFDHGYDMPILRQFASWTIMSKPRKPHMLQVVEDIMDSLQEKMAVNNVTIQGIKLDMVGDVVDFTGPRRLTNSIYKSLQKTHNITVNIDDIAELVRPKMIGDVLVMPGRSITREAGRIRLAGNLHELVPNQSNPNAIVSQREHCAPNPSRPSLRIPRLSTVDPDRLLATLPDPRPPAGVNPTGSCGFIDGK